MRIIALAAFLSLSACIDADLTLNFLPGGAVETTVQTSLSSKLFAMLGKSPEAACKGGKATNTPDGFTCEITKSTTVDDLIAKADNARADDPLGLASGALIERVSDSRVRITFDFQKMLNNRPDSPGQDQLGALGPMLKSMVADKALTFTLKGRKILETSGTMSADATSASFALPIAKLLDANPDLGPAFVTLIQTEKECTLWIFCS